MSVYTMMKKNKIKKIIFFLLPFIVFSCTFLPERDELQENSPYQGVWEGTFSGDDKGWLSFTVLSSGHIVEGKWISAEYNYTDELLGYVGPGGKFNINTRKLLYISGFLVENKSDGEWYKLLQSHKERGKYSISKIK